MITTAAVDVYARVSHKGDKEQKSTSGQVQVCKAVLAERGLPEGVTHVDDGKSAWNPKVDRAGWDALMARLESGAAGGVIVFDLERFTRQPHEGERLIEAAERGLLVLDSDSEYDLTSPGGKKSFRDAMNAAAYYGDLLSKRVKRGKRLKAMSGGPNGRVSKDRGPFGFLPDGITPHPDESVILREITARFLAGETQDALIADLRERGITTAIEGAWTRRSLHDVLVRPLNAGLVVHRGAVVATLPGKPVIDRDDHDLVLATYAARRPGRPPSGAYLCSGLASCGLCGKPLGGRPRAHLAPYADGGVKREYWCTRTGYGGCGHVYVDQRALDLHARELAIAVLSDAERAHAVEIAAAQAEAEAAGLDEQIGKGEELGRKLADRLGRGELDIDRYDAAIAALDKRLASLRGRRKALGTGPARVPVDTEAAWRVRWAEGTPEDRRRWLGIALNGTRLIVGPAVSGRRSDVAARVTVSG